MKKIENNFEKSDAAIFFRALPYTKDLGVWTNFVTSMNDYLERTRVEEEADEPEA